jgi:hypothetical protein
MNRRIKKIDVKARGSLKNIELLCRYLDQMDNKIMKGLESNLEISLCAVKRKRRKLNCTSATMLIWRKLASITGSIS